MPDAYRPVEPIDTVAAVWPAPVAPVARGEQMVLIAKTEPAARCLLLVTSPAGQPALTQPAHADANGLVFWLWTVPEETNRGTARLTMSCGSASVRSRLTIT